MEKLRSILLVLSIWLFVQATPTNYFTICPSNKNLSLIVVNKTFTEPVSILPLRNKGKIAGLCISGKVMKQSDDYLVRVILKDNVGHKHCVLESYNMVNDSLSFTFTDYCEETAILDNIETDSLLIYVHNAALKLDNISTVGEMRPGNSKNSSMIEIKKAQVMDITNRINAYNRTNRKFWGAAETPLSLKRYEEKMKCLGLDDNESTEGFEYYCSGIFVSGPTSFAERDSYSLCVPLFDWCNRHGRNWVTGIRDQGNSGFCFAFTAVAAIESMLMLYYNSNDSVLLSADQAARCTYSNAYVTYHEGGYADDALEYAKNNGICDNESFPFVDTDTIPCRTNIISPNEIVKISDYSYHSHNNENAVKTRLIDNGPMTSGYLGHAMLLVGYGVVQVGDVIRVNNGIGNTSNNYTVMESDTDYVGKTYWKFKNSYGYNPYKTVDGYSYVIFNDLYYMRQPCSVYHPYCVINTSYNNVICEDKDGDGLYFWGLADKPDYCPDWVPDIPDGDDSNYAKGEMLLIPKGELMDLDPNGESAIIITGNVTYTTRQSQYRHIVIANGATLTVKNILNLFGRVTITVQSGAQLIIDGGVVTNTCINLAQGSQLIITNGGKLVMRTNTSFEAPLGAVVQIQQGEIIRSNDY